MCTLNLFKLYTYFVCQTLNRLMYIGRNVRARHQQSNRAMTLGDYNIHDKSCLNLLKRLRGGTM